MRCIANMSYSEEGKQKLREELEKIRMTLNFGEELDEQKKAEYEARIQTKLERGKRLSAKEMKYLKQYNPVMYMHALRIEMQRHALEKRLENARSKQEVQEIQAEAMAAIGKDDPVKKYMVAMVQDTVTEFKKTEAYKRLPEKEEERKTRANDAERGMKSKAGAEEEKIMITYESKKGAYQMAFAVDAADVHTGFSIRS